MLYALALAPIAASTPRIIYLPHHMAAARKKHHTRDERLLIALNALLVLALLATLIYVFLGGTNVKTGTKPALPTADKQAPAPTFLHEEEAVIIQSETGEDEVLPIEPVLFEYVEITDGCGPHFEGECLRVRSGPGTEYPVVLGLRNGMVLKVGGKVEHDGMTWYKIVFDEWLRYPERVAGDWYVAANYVSVLLDEGDKVLTASSTIASTTKRILVDRSEQKVYAYEGDTLFMEESISTGLELTPTPRGSFTIYKKTPSRYMQGPLPYLTVQDHYDLPGVPWNLYFTEQGAVFHGAYWHANFGSPFSHGCVNLSPENARKLYMWADLGTPVVVRD